MKLDRVLNEPRPVTSRVGRVLITITEHTGERKEAF